MIDNPRTAVSAYYNSRGAAVVVFDPSVLRPSTGLQEGDR